MARSEIVVALDIGTTKVCALVGEVSGEDQIEILGVGLTPSTGMRKGVVTDISATSAAIRDAVETAAKMASVHVATVYAGITGEHIASLNNRGSVNLTDEVTEEHVLQARNAARQVVMPNDREVLHNITRQYILDGQEGVRHPVGMSGKRLEVETHVVTAATSFIENVAKCVHRARLEIEDIVVEPLATGLAVLTDAERQLGVVVADIGGGTTDVALFQDGAITHTSIIPVGGNHVTQDLCVGFRLDPDEAERVKLQHGAARADDVDPEEYVELRRVGEEESVELPRRLLTEIIGPRMEQIFDLLRAHVDRAAADGVQVSTCVLSGGGSLLPGAVELAHEALEMPVRIGRPREVIDPRGLAEGPMFATGVGLLRFAAQRIAGRRPAKESSSLPAAALHRLLRMFRVRKAKR